LARAALVLALRVNRARRRRGAPVGADRALQAAL